MSEMKWRLKSCPRCGGDIMIYDDYDGWHEACLQCGYQVELENFDIVDYVHVKNASDNRDTSECSNLQSITTGKE